MGATGRAAALLLGGMVAACGGGGGGGAGGGAPVATTPPPPVAPPPAPPPPPSTAPPPVTTVPPGTPNDPTFVTQEYRDSIGAANAYSVFAYQRGATGTGVTAAVIDTGINTASSEFAGRILPASRDVVGSRPINDVDGHGNAVAGLLAGARDDRGIHGVAYAANLLVLRADSLNSCNTDCTFADSALARAVDVAVAERARVINFSLGGGAADPDLAAAIGRAAAAGIVTVISGGNGARASPDLFAQVALDPAVQGMVVIAGAANSGGTELTSFADRAGIAAEHYIAATGESLRILTLDGGLELGDGASYATPIVAGAVALLAQAFPNLSGRQVIDLLYSSATDTGAPGVDPVNGRGALNLTRAFAPQGTMALAGGSAPVSLTQNATLSAPMGDAGGTIGATALDGLGRAYTVVLGRTLGQAPPRARLAAALLGDARLQVARAGGLDVSVTAQSEVARSPGVASDAEGPRRALAGSIGGRLDGRTTFAVAAAGSAVALVDRLAGTNPPALLVATDAGDTGLAARPDAAAAARRAVAGFGVTLALEGGDIATWGRSGGRPFRTDSSYGRTTLALDRRFGPLGTTFAATWLDESATLLGARFGPALGGARGTTTFLDLGGVLEAGGGWRLNGSLRRGWTAASLRGVEGSGALRSGAWSLGVGRSGVFAPGDAFDLRLAQPLRVARGGLALTLPSSWDYSAGVVDSWSSQRLELAPSGRELDVELGYAHVLPGGWAALNLFWRRDPGHQAALPDDWGAALRLSLTRW